MKGKVLLFLLAIGLAFSASAQRTTVTDVLQLPSAGKKVTSIMTDTTLTGATDAMLISAKAVKDYVDNHAGGGGGGPTYTAGTGIGIASNVISNEGVTSVNGEIGDITDVLKTTDPVGGTGGDVTGTLDEMVVTGIQGQPLSGDTPSTGEVLKWNGTSWVPAGDDSGGGAVLPKDQLPLFFNISNLKTTSSYLDRVRDGLDSLNVLTLGHSQVEFRPGWEYNLQKIMGQSLPVSGAGFVTTNPQSYFIGIPFNFASRNWTVKDRNTGGKGINLYSVISTGSSLSISLTSAAPTSSYTKFTEVELWYYGDPTGNTFTVTIDGVLAATVNTTLTTGFQVKRISGLTDAVHDVVINAAGAGVEFLGWVFSRNAVQKGFRLYNCGQTSVTSAMYAGLDSTLWTQQIQRINPKLIVFDLGVNDRRANVDTTIFKNNMRTIVNRLQIAAPLADIVIVGQYPFDTVTWGTPTYSAYAYNRQVRAVSVEKKCVYFDAWTLFRSYSDMVLRHQIGPDKLHLDTLGGTILVSNILHVLPGFNQITKATVLSASLPAAVSGTGSETSPIAITIPGTKSDRNLLYMNSSGQIVGSDSLYYRYDLKRLGFNTASPLGPLHVAGAVAGATEFVQYIESKNIPSGYAPYLNMYANLTAGQEGYFAFGKSGTTRDRASISFLYAGAGSTANAVKVAFFAGKTPLYILGSGNIGIEKPAPSSAIDIRAGVSAPGGAPFGFTIAGAQLLSTPERGKMEVLGNKLYYTDSTLTRREIRFKDQVTEAIPMLVTAPTVDFTSTGVIADGAWRVPSTFSGWTLHGYTVSLYTAGSGGGSLILQVQRTTTGGSSSSGCSMAFSPGDVQKDVTGCGLTLTTGDMLRINVGTNDFVTPAQGVVVTYILKP